MIRSPKDYVETPRAFTTCIRDLRYVSTDRQRYEAYAMALDAGALTQADAACLWSVWQWECCNRPIVYPTREVVSACAATPVLDNVAACEVRQVYPSILFIMPRGCSAQYLLWTHKTNGSTMQTDTTFGPIGHYRMPDVCTNGFGTIGVFDREAVVANINMSGRESVADVIASTANDRMYDVGPEVSAPETDHLRSCLAMAVNLVMLMQAYPHVVEKIPVRMRPMGCKKTIAHTAQRINHKLAGVKTIVEQPPAPDGRGGGCVIRPHQRIGHWRRQRHSEGWELRHPNAVTVTFRDGSRGHWVWIPPTYVMGHRPAQVV
jgi:hypothetical protein